MGAAGRWIQDGLAFRREEAVMKMNESQRGTLQVAGLVLFFLGAFAALVSPVLFVIAFVGAVMFLEGRYQRAGT
jgi:uncharacterized membrane protein HdeD (DUF308 family)